MIYPHSLAHTKKGEKWAKSKSTKENIVAYRALCTLLETRKDKPKHTHILSKKQEYKHTNIGTQTQANIHTLKHTHTHTQMHTNYTNIHKHIHTHKHTQIYIYIYIYIYILTDLDTMPTTKKHKETVMYTDIFKDMQIDAQTCTNK